MMEASSKDKSSALLKKVTENYAAIQANTPEEKEKSSLQLPKQIRTYWWRWWVLGVLMSNNILANLLWITFAPVADVMRCYYNITNDVVNALSLASAGITLLLVLPSAWCLSRFGLRFTLILSSIAAALGAGIRVMGAGAGYFSLLMTGQIVSSFDGILEGGFTLFSEVWFPSSERATATALSASIAPQMGVLLGYGLSPNVIHSDYTAEVCNSSLPLNTTRHHEHFDAWNQSTYHQIFYYLLAQALLALLVLFLSLIAFPEAPPTPPSLSRLLEKQTRPHLSRSQQLLEFLMSLLEFVRNKPFLLFLLCTGIHVGASGAVGSLVNEMVLPYFPGKDRMIAYLGITMKISSIIGLLVVGRLIDWTKAFYWIFVSIYFITAVSVATFAAVVQFQSHTYPLYIAIALMGGSFSSFQVVALEYSVEITYPLPEGTSAGFLNFSSMAFATILIVSFGRFSSGRVFIGMWLIVGFLVLGAVLSVFVRPELRRVKIDSHQKYPTES